MLVEIQKRVYNSMCGASEWWEGCGVEVGRIRYADPCRTLLYNCLVCLELP